MLTRTHLHIAPLARLGREMDRLFESMISGEPGRSPFGAATQSVSTPLNLWEDDESLYAETELPGVNLEDIAIHVADDLLTIKGIRTIARAEGARLLRRERGSGRFERNVHLPSGVDVEAVEATLNNGVLTVTLPKIKAPVPRKIEVKVLTDESGGA